MAMINAIRANAAAQDHDDGDLGGDIAMLHAAGWLTACLPARLGGQGWGCEWAGLPDAILALRLTGYANLATARLFEGHMNAAKLIALHAAPITAERIAQDVADGALLGVWGADHASHPVSLEPAEEGSNLRGTKQFASGLGLVSHAVIIAATGRGWGEDREAGPAHTGADGRSGALRPDTLAYGWNAGHAIGSLSVR